MFRRKKQEIPPYNDTRISVRVVMRDGRNVVFKVEPQEFETARFDMTRHSPNENSLIYIGTIIAHVSEFKKIERA